MRHSHFLIAVLDGSTVDEGVAFEIGYMFAAGKTCIGLQTDVRRALPTGNNPMIGMALTLIFQSVTDLVDWTSEQKAELHSNRYLRRVLGLSSGGVGG